jgi:hypothetical protein
MGCPQLTLLYELVLEPFLGPFCNTRWDKGAMLLERGIDLRRAT